MWVTMREMTVMARPGRFALAAFHAANLEQVQAVMEAALEMRSPAIVALDEASAIYAGAGPFLSMVKELSLELPVPVTVQLDHVHDLDLVARSLDRGATAVLYDPRDDSASEGRKRAESARELCRKSEAWFELEVRGADHRRRPEEAVGLWRDVKPDCACIALTQEEREKPGEEFFALAEALKKEGALVSVAGAGAWAESDIRRAVALGVWKISVGTRLNQAFTNGLKRFLADYAGIHPRAYLGAARDEARKEAAACIRAFGSEGSA